ncbi:hypothetical protein KJ840_04590 [Patescibacteria group bacterium]|nr:hypothetical protein [Patescibacteria group bacterium]
MYPDKWEEIKVKIKNNFEVIEEFKENDEERREDIEAIEFKGPLGKMKVEWITRPKVLDKKTQYSRRIGGDISVDYVYSEDEVTHTFKVYKYDEAGGNWQEMRGDSFI